MPKYDIDNDPAFDMSEQAKAAASERELDRILGEITKAEKAREAAATQVKTLWRLVEKRGFNLRDARQRHLRSLLDG